MSVRSRAGDLLGSVSRGVLSRTRLVGAIRLALLLLLVTAGWCVTLNRIDLRGWQTPLSQDGDALVVLARMQSAAQGHYWPILSKRVPELGAPYGATWDGHPTSEDWLYTSAGGLARWIGLFPAANLTVLLASILAALSTYLCCRNLRCRWEWSFLCALAFAWSPYAFFRGLNHVMLAYDWLVPPSALITLWLLRRADVKLGRASLAIAFLIAWAVGWHNVYYAYFFVQWMALAGVVRLARRRDWRVLRLPALLAGTTAAGWLLANVDSLPFLWAHRGESSSFYRSLEEMRAYALRPLALAMPMPSHRWAWWAHWGDLFRPGADGNNEAFYSYLGLLGLAALTALGIHGVVKMARRPSRPLPGQAWLILWILVFSTVGGLNELLGLLGLRSFRALNRSSIAILALALLFFAQFLTVRGRAWPAWRRLVTWAALCALVAWDQLPIYVGPAQIEPTAARVASDRAFVAAIEKRLPAGAMVFQLPMAGFPETPAINGMQGYEHLRPYLHATHLRFSYGTHKLDERAGWQQELEGLEPGSLADRLERYGFVAIALNRAGYPDRGESLIQGLRASGRDQVLASPLGDLVCVFLHPVASPQLPEVFATFGRGWYQIEPDAEGNRWRWSEANAQLKLVNTTSQTMTRTLSFRAQALLSRRLLVRSGGIAILERAILPGQPPVPIQVTMTLPPGSTKLEWTSDVPGASPSPQDPRPVAFMIGDLQVSEAP